MSPMQAEVEAVMARHLDAGPQTPLAVAFSGGSDSLAALLLTLDFAAKRGRRVLALSVDHGLQAASRGWTQHCAALAARLGAEPVSLAWQGDKPSTGLPAAARAARHRLLAQAAKAQGAKVVILGHTQDDGREGDWMRQEGSTLGQLRPWAPSPVWPQGRGLFLLRPLLSQSREALRALVRGRGLDWIEDPANQDPQFARARARLALRDGGLASPEPSAQSGTACWPEDLGPWTAYGALRLDRRALSARPGGLDAFLSRALMCVSGAEGAVRSGSVQRLSARLSGSDLFTATLSGAQVQATADHVWIVREAGRKGLAPLDARSHQDGQAAPLWDGRFHPGPLPDLGQVTALRGHAAGLDEADRKRLGRLPAPIRPTLPILLTAEGAARLPLFGQPFGHEPKAPIFAVQSVILQRLEAACGRIVAESAIE